MRVINVKVLYAIIAYTQIIRGGIIVMSVKAKNESMEVWVSDTGQKLMIHKKGVCTGACPVHKSSSHHMRKWKLHWREDRKMMERICEHGIGHPDPDDTAFRKTAYKDDDTVHGCDGCCVKNKKKIVEEYKKSVSSD